MRTHENSSLPEVNELFTIRTALKSTYGDLTGIFLEHLFDDLFELRDRFKELGMFIEDGEVRLRDLEVKNDWL